MTTFIIISVLLLTVIIRDLAQKKHTISRNFPLVGHIRYIAERIGPPIRQYIIANDREEKPFNRIQRAWIYASSKKQNNHSGFGSKLDFTAPGHIIIKHAPFPQIVPNMGQPMGMKKTMGPRRQKPYRPSSIVNISAMSYGALSPTAVEALNKGALMAGCYQNTGEGGFSKFHDNGADVVFQIGTAYFGCRDAEGKFSLEILAALCERHPCIKAIEIKLSQGAKPGKGGELPGSKVTAEIAEARGIKIGQDAISPVAHAAFDNIESMCMFIERVAGRTGLPVGIKSAVGHSWFWKELFEFMQRIGMGPDFITIDGGEGGTGSAPGTFADHVALPLNEALATVMNAKFEVLATYGDKHESKLSEMVTIASAKLGFPHEVVKAFAMKADGVNVAREALLALGCIQAGQCHLNTCPSGAATQNKWLYKGLDPAVKSHRVAAYIKTLRKEIRDLTIAAGHQHPSEFGEGEVLIRRSDKLLQVDKYETWI